MAALKVRSFLPAKAGGDIKLDPVASLTVSVNRLGATVEDIGKILANQYKSKIDTAAATRSAGRAADSAREARIEKKVGKDVAKEASNNKPSEKAGSWLDRLLEPFKWIAEKAAVWFFLKWLGDPKNEGFLRKTLPIIGRWLRTAFNFAWQGINLIMDAFGEKSLLMSALKIVGGIAALYLADRILKPWKLLGDLAYLARTFSPKRRKVKPGAESKTTLLNQRQRRPAAGVRSSQASKEARKRYQQRYGDAAARRRFAGRVKGRASFRGATTLGRAGRMLNTGMGAGLLTGVVSVGSRLAAGDSVQKAVGGGVGATIGTVALTALLTPVLGPFAPLVGGTLGGFLGDRVGAFIGDAITPILKPLQNLFTEILFPTFKATIKPLIDPMIELFGEIGKALKMIYSALEPIVSPVVKEIVEFLNSNVVGPAIEAMKAAINAAGEIIGGVVESTGDTLTKIDFLGLYSTEVDKANVNLKDANKELTAAEKNLKYWEKVVREKGPDHKDFADFSPASEDLANARKRLERAQTLVKRREEELAVAKNEQERLAQAEADRRNKDSESYAPNLGDRQGSKVTGGHIVTSAMGQRGFALSPGMHMGVDIATGIGEQLIAFTDGLVEATGWDGGYGNWVNWIDKDGYGNFYAHMDKPAFVKAGQKVKKGTVLGLTGNTGRSSGPHLHWEVAKNPTDTGRSKANVLSRINPLSRYDKEHPFGGGPSLGRSGPGGGGIAGKTTDIRGINRSNAELNSRSKDEARQELVGGAKSKPVVIIQPVAKPIVQQVSSGAQTFAPTAVPTSVT